MGPIEIGTTVETTSTTSHLGQRETYWRRNCDGREDGVVWFGLAAALFCLEVAGGGIREVWDGCFGESHTACFNSHSKIG